MTTMLEGLGEGPTEGLGEGPMGVVLDEEERMVMSGRWEDTSSELSPLGMSDTLSVSPLLGPPPSDMDFASAMGNLLLDFPDLVTNPFKLDDVKVEGGESDPGGVGSGGITEEPESRKRKRTDRSAPRSESPLELSQERLRTISSAEYAALLDDYKAQRGQLTREEKHKTQRHKRLIRNREYAQRKRRANKEKVKHTMATVEEQADRIKFLEYENRSLRSEVARLYDVITRIVGAGPVPKEVAQLPMFRSRPDHNLAATPSLSTGASLLVVLLSVGILVNLVFLGVTPFPAGSGGAPLGGTRSLLGLPGAAARFSWGWVSELLLPREKPPTVEDETQAALLDNLRSGLGDDASARTGGSVTRTASHSEVPSNIVHVDYEYDNAESYGDTWSCSDSIFSQLNLTSTVPRSFSIAA